MVTCTAILNAGWGLLYVSLCQKLFYGHSELPKYTQQDTGSTDKPLQVVKYINGYQMFCTTLCKSISSCFLDSLQPAAGLHSSLSTIKTCCHWSICFHTMNKPYNSPLGGGPKPSFSSSLFAPLPLDSTEHVSVTGRVYHCFVPSSARLNIPLGAFRSRASCLPDVVDLHRLCLFHNFSRNLRSAQSCFWDTAETCRGAAGGKHRVELPRSAPVTVSCP